MITIGLRATPAAVTFAIYDSKAKNIVNVEQLRIPAVLYKPDALKFVRNNLLDILREYNVDRAGVRVTEPVAQKPNIDRVQIEGVIQETFASSSLKAYYIGQVSSISARCEFPRTDFKKFVSGDAEFPVSNWKDHSDVEREAILCAVGAARD